MKQLEKFFDIETAYAKKHKLNTCNKRVPQEYLDKIEDGCSIEDLEEMMKNRFDIFKYKTQITIHGIFPEISTRRIGGYVNLTQNQNKSVGVRYSAIDYEKKSRLYKILADVGGWGIERNSVSFSIHKMKELPWASECKSKEEFLERCQNIVKEFREIADRIDRSLFVGYVDCYLAQTLWGSKIIVLSVNVMCFYEKNFKAIVENISGKTFAECETICEEKRIERERLKKERDERWAIERAKAAEEKKAKKEKFLAENPIPDGFSHIDEEYSPQVGDIVMKLEDGWSGYKFVFYTFVKHGGRLLIKPCDINGENVKSGHEFKKGTIKGGWLKKHVEKESVFALTSPSQLVINKISSTQIILLGETYPIRAKIKELGGKWNKWKKGWTFDSSAESRVRSAFAL